MSFNPGDVLVIRIDEDGNTLQELIATRSGSSLTFNDQVNFEGGLTSSGAELNQDFLPISGGTLTGPLVLNGTPTLSGEAIAKSYLDAELSATSGTLQSTINLKSDLSYVNTQDSLISGALRADVDLKANLVYVNDQDLAVLVSGSNSLNTASGTLRSYSDLVAANAVTSGTNSLTASSGTLQSDINNRALTSYVNIQDSTLSGLIDQRLSLSGGTMSGPITLDGNPTLSGQASNKNYVDSSITTLSGFCQSTFVNTSGDSLTGFLTLHADPTVSGHAATKQYVDALVAAQTRTVQQVVFGTSSNGLQTSSTTYQAYNYFMFEGTDIVGSILNIKFVMSSSNAGSTSEARIVDITNGNAVIASATTNSTTREIVLSTNVANVPASQAVWQIQLRRGGSNNNVRVHSVLIECEN